MEIVLSRTSHTYQDLIPHRHRRRRLVVIIIIINRVTYTYNATLTASAAMLQRLSCVTQRRIRPLNSCFRHAAVGQATVLQC